MALSESSRSQIKKAWAHYVRANEVDAQDLDAVVECLFDNWDTLTSGSLTDAYVTQQDTADRAAINVKQKAELEAAGYTVTAP